MLKDKLSKYTEVDLDSKILGLSSLELVVLTYDKIDESLRFTRDAIVNNSPPFLFSEKAINYIQLGLQAALNMKEGGEIAVNLSRIYDWSVSQILKGCATKSPELIDGVIDVLSSLGSAWIALNERKSNENLDSVRAPHVDAEVMR